jgi:hypothetical protein
VESLHSLSKYTFFLSILFTDDRLRIYTILLLGNSLNTHHIDTNNYIDIPTGRKTSVDQGKDGKTNAHEEGKSLLVLRSTNASNINCTIYENNIPTTAVLYGREPSL